MAAILVKFGFEDLLLRLGLNELLEYVRGLVGLRQQNRAEIVSRPERVRLAVEELGLVFIK